MKKAAQVIIVMALLFSLGACKELFSEGDPVPAKEGIAHKWQDDSNPDRIMVFKKDMTGNFIDNSSGTDLAFKYSFVDDDTVKTEFPNGKSVEFKVKTTTLYMWMTDDSGTNRLHKME